VPFLAWFAVLIGGFLIQALFAKKPKPPRATTLDDFEVPQIEEGTPQAVVFGDVWLEGWQVVWYGNYRTTKIKSKGKKK
jgi:hypothetical protein